MCCTNVCAGTYLISRFLIVPPEDEPSAYRFTTDPFECSFTVCNSWTFICRFAASEASSRALAGHSYADSPCASNIIVSVASPCALV